MPVIVPGVLERNLTPTSTALVSLSLAVAGVAVGAQIEHGQVDPGGVTVAFWVGAGAPRMKSSVTRAVIAWFPPVAGVQLKLQVRSGLTVAACQVEPPSVETSTWRTPATSR